MRWIIQAICVLAATEWHQDMVRGLARYTLAAGGGNAMLVCDPDRVFGATSNASLVVTMPEDADATLVVLLSATGEQAALPLVERRAAEKDVDPAEWRQMVEIVRAGGSFAFVTGEDAMRLDDVAPLPSLYC
ncbi:hypothetical protein [Jannaschia sp. 2305UL9-9]|uniref:hypothetical protein n=1 Tax=Jannaschia sp. 2305UL9-9 TaxID=3121638 RepID=UPI003528C914